MIETSAEQILAKAVELSRAKTKWHFHMLSPNCVFNTAKERHALILESSDEVYLSYSFENTEAGKTLVKLLHGNKILEEKQKEKNLENSAVSEIVKKARELNEKKIPWHHHFLFPECVFNTEKPLWKIIFESKGEFLETSFTKDPKDDLGRIELLFYAQNR